MSPVTKAQLLDVLAELHDVAPSQRKALKGRLQHLQKMGFPAGANVGRGRATKYDAVAIAKVVIAFELLQFGITPERAAGMVRALAPGWLSHRAASAGHLITRGEEDGEEDHFLLFHPAALVSLSGAADDSEFLLRSAASFDRDKLSDAIGFQDSDETDRLQGLHRRFAAINLTSLLYHAAIRLNEQAGVPHQAFGEALMAWGADNEWSPPDD